MELKQIKSFQVNHKNLEPGVYVSRIDYAGETPITTYDIRLFKPNNGAYLSTGIAHTIEHLGATWLRSNDAISDDVIYFGPMGCRTGFYLVMNGEHREDILNLLEEMFSFMANFEGEIPGATEVECGNYLDQDLDGLKELAKGYASVVLEQKEGNPALEYSRD